MNEKNIKKATKMEIINSIQFNRANIKFNGKPSAEVRTAMKNEGWVYSSNHDVWYPKNDAATNSIEFAKQLQNEYFPEQNHDPNIITEETEKMEIQDLIRDSKSVDEVLTKMTEFYGVETINKALEIIQKNNTFSESIQNVKPDSLEVAVQNTKTGDYIHIQQSDEYIWDFTSYTSDFNEIDGGVADDIPSTKESEDIREALKGVIKQLYPSSNISDWEETDLNILQENIEKVEAERYEKISKAAQQKIENHDNGVEQAQDELDSQEMNEEAVATKRLDELISTFKKYETEFKVLETNKLLSVELLDKEGNTLYKKEQTDNIVMPIKSEVAVWDKEFKDLHAAAEEYFNLLIDNDIRGDYVNKSFTKPLSNEYINQLDAEAEDMERANGLREMEDDVELPWDEKISPEMEDRINSGEIFGTVDNSNQDYHSELINLGYEIIDWEDGSGHISDPNGKKIVEWDKSANEYKWADKSWTNAEFDWPDFEKEIYLNFKEISIARAKFGDIVRESLLALTDEEKENGTTVEQKNKRYETWYKADVDEIMAEIGNGNKEVMAIVQNFDLNREKHVEGNKWYSPDEAYFRDVQYKLLPELYSKTQDRIKAEYEEKKIPYVVMYSSESPKFPSENKVYTVKEFNEILLQADSEFHNRKKYAEEKYGSADNYWNLENEDKLPEEDKGIQFGYDKTNFKFFNIPNPNNPEDTFSYEPSRYDIGDGNGSVFDYVRSTCSHDEFIEALNALETQLYFPGVPEDIKKDVETIVEKQSAILKENLKEKIANLDKAQNEYKELHKKWLIEATEADRVDELLKNSLNEIKDTYDNSIKAIYEDVLEQRSFISSYEENSEVRRFISNEAKKMIVSELYLPSRDAQKAMNAEDYKTYNSIDWAKLRRIWEKFPANVNMSSYTTELLNSVCEEHSINQKEKIENIKIVDNTQETISNETELTQEDIDLCKKVIPPAQFKFTMELAEGEEGEFFRNKMKEIADTYRRINTDRELINKDGTHQLGFRYFLGDTEIFLSEIDSDGIGFGYTILNGDLQMSEWGSTSLEEIMKIPYIEMDYHVPEEITIERMLYQEHPEYFSEYAPKEEVKQGRDASSYTNEILDKIRAAGIEVVMDKKQFDEILESENILQKMSNDEIIRNMAKERDAAIEEKNKNNEKKLEEFKAEVKSYAPLIKELIKTGNTLLENGFDLEGWRGYTGKYSDGSFYADGWTHKFGFKSSNGKITAVGRSLGDNEEKYFIYSDGENIEIGPYTFRYDHDYDWEPKKWLEGIQEFKTVLSQKFGLNFDNIERELIQGNETAINEKIPNIDDFSSYFEFNSEDVDKFNKQIEEWENDNTNPDKLIIVGHIPPVMQLLNIDDNLIEVEQGTLNKIVREVPLYPTDKQGHNLSKNIILSIPAELADPVMIFKSRTREDSFVFFTEQKDENDRTVLIPLAVNKKKGRIFINEITSMYGRNNEIDFVKSNVDEDKLVYLDKTRTHEWIEQQLINEKSLGGDRAFKVQFLEQRVTDIETYNPSILTKDKLVKFISSGINPSIQKMVTAENTYGFVHNGKIYLNPDIINTNAAIHEYTHLWDAYTQKTNPELWNKGFEIFRDTKYWNEVISDPNYQDIKNDENLVLSEIHSRICGDMAEKVLNRIAELDGEQVKLEAIDWNKETAGYVLDLIKEINPHNDFIQNMKKEDISQNVLEFFSTPMKDLIQGTNINNPVIFNFDEFTKENFDRFVQGYNTSLAVGRDGEGEYYGRLKTGKVHTDIHIRDNGISLEHYYPKDDSEYGEYEGKNGKFNYESYPGFLLREETLKDIDISNCTYDEFISFISKECIDSMKDNEEVFEAAKGPLVSWEDIATEKGNALKPYNFFVSDSQNLDLGLFQDFDTITGLSAEQAALKYAELKDKGLSPYIGLNIPGDRIFDDKEGQGAGIFTEMEGTPSFYIGDSFVKGLKVNDEHAKNVIAAYKELYEATNKYILGVEKPSFVFEKEEELNRPAEPLKVYTFSPFGYEGMVVQVETDIRKGIPAFDIVGIADSAVKETRERIRVAFSRSGLEFPSERVLQALSPADLRKDSPMDLAMALGILGTTKAYPVDGPVLALGELELSGRIRPVRGAVAAVNSAKALGITNIVCDPSTAELLKNIEGINILSAESLKDVDEKLMVAESFEKTSAVGQDTDEVQFNEEWMEDYKEALDNLPMDGHFETIRAIEIAVAGKHNILATGAPGCGKTLLTQTLMPALTPKMTQEESKVITRINSIAGLDSPKRDKLVPPFRMPHQTATIEGICGGGPNCRPGEISLAHQGTLFMDETAEFRSSVIQILRVPLESRQITLSRAGRSTSYPADFQLAMAMNPCPCGCYGSKDKICLDSARSIELYWKKISDPLLDRVEIKTFVQKDMNDTRKVSIEQMKASIKKAYEIQRKRGVYNSHMTPEQIQMYCKLDKESQAYLDKEEEKLTPRGKSNLLKLSLTIANMDGREEIRINDIKEARELSAPVFEKPKQYVYNPEQNEEVVVSINNDTYLTKKVESVIELANPDNLTESKDEAALLKRDEAEFIVDVLNRDKAKYNLKSEFGIESSEVHENEASYQREKDEFNGYWIPHHNAKVAKRGLEENKAPFLPDASGNIKVDPIYNGATGYCLPAGRLLPVQFAKMEYGYESNIVFPRSTIRSLGHSIKENEKGVFYNFKDEQGEIYVASFFYPEQTENPEGIINSVKDKIVQLDNLKDVSMVIASSEPIEYLGTYMAATRSGMKLSVDPQLAEEFKSKLMPILENDIRDPEHRNKDLPSFSSILFDADKRGATICRTLAAEMGPSVEQKNVDMVFENSPEYSVDVDSIVMESEAQTAGRGGARPGAGRPATGIHTKKLTICVDLLTSKVLENEASEAGMTVNKFIAMKAKMAMAQINEAESMAKETTVPTEELNPGNNDPYVTPEQIKEAENEQDRILEPVLNGERTGMYKAFKDFKDRGVFDIKGAQVKLAKNGGLTPTGWKQLHAAMEIYRSKKFETFRYIMIDRKTGEIADQLAITSHMPNFCNVSKPNDETLKQVISRAEEKDYLIAVCHNHPSGNTTESSFDRELTDSLDRSLRRNDGLNRFLGHIILDHDTFNLAVPSPSRAGHCNWKKMEPMEVTTVDRFTADPKPEWVGNYVGGTTALKEVAKKVNDTENWNDDFIPVVFTNADRNISGVQYYSKNFFENESDKIRNEFQSAAMEAGAIGAFPVITDSLWEKLDKKATDFEAMMKAHVLNDAFTDVAFNHTTMTEKYDIEAGKNYYSFYREQSDRKIDVAATWEPKVNTRLFPQEVQETITHYQTVQKSLAKEKTDDIFNHNFMLKNNFYPPFIVKDNKYIVRCTNKDLSVKYQTGKDNYYLNLEITKEQFAKAIATHKVCEKIKRYKDAKEKKQKPIPITSSAVIFENKAHIAVPSNEQKALIVENNLDLKGKNSLIKDEFKKIAEPLAWEVSKIEPIFEPSVSNEKTQKNMSTEKNQEEYVGFDM